MPALPLPFCQRLTPLRCGADQRLTNGSTVAFAQARELAKHQSRTAQAELTVSIVAGDVEARVEAEQRALKETERRVAVRHGGLQLQSLWVIPTAAVS